MLGISQNRDDATRCRYCGEKLSLLQRLSRAEYCNAGHKEAFQRDQEKLALDRLQQVVAEGRESEVQSRLARGKAKQQQPAAGAWPQELTPIPPSKKRPPAGVTYEEPEEPRPSRPSLYGPIYGSDLAATGQISPTFYGLDTAEMLPLSRRMPETPAELGQPRVQAAPGMQLNLGVAALEGERLGKPVEYQSETVSRGTMRFPELSIQSLDWSEALERARRASTAIPPLAGLIQIAGPQTLRFRSRPRSPMPLPEAPSGTVVRAYKPGLAGGSGVPGLAGAIRGLGTWRTRFGSEGNLKPQWESGWTEVKPEASVTPKYPVFYTTSPWAGEGLEQIFGLGPGNGPGPEVEAGSPPAPTEVSGPLVFREPEASPAPMPKVEPERSTAKKPPAPIPIRVKPASGGAGEGTGAVSVEAVAALVKAARQSDRSRTPLRDVDIRLLSRSASPKMAASRPWRKLLEGAARGLSGRGPILTKAPMADPLAAMPHVRQDVAADPAPVLPAAPPAPVFQSDLPVPPVLALAPVREWSGAWLRPVAGPCDMRLAAADPLEIRSRARVPEHRVRGPVTGGASRLQPSVELPEPWIEIRETPAWRAGAQTDQPIAGAAELRRPAGWRPPGSPSERDPNLGLGRLERPGPQWVLLRGSSEAATFRMALDQLRLQEPGTPRTAEWGPVGSHSTTAKPAGLPASRGIVHRDLTLQRADAEPCLVPVVCQFGSAGGGTWV
jgi:hypothetical protein